MPLPSIHADCFVNPAASAARQRIEPYGDRARVLSRVALTAAQAEISAWPGYQPTPLTSLPALADALKIARVDYKDEGGRFDLGSFKALGGAYAVARLMCREVERRTGKPCRPVDLGSPEAGAICADVTVTCATDGNHGRSVAWGARMFGCRCVIYIHATVSEQRRAAIARYGADVVRTEGNYDDSVRRADADARTHGWFVVSDTSYPGYMDVPRDVMQGYQVMVAEALEQLAEWPTHVFVQAGVGGFAAAVCGWFWERDAARRPVFVVVEPTRADCLMQSTRRGELTAVTGDLDTLMAGLACGEVSPLAWQILAEGADAFMTVDDDAAVAAMRLLARPLPGDTPIAAGESAVAGLAGLMAATQDDATRAALALDADSRVLLFGSEGDTDPQQYEALVGATADDVRTGKAIS